MVVARQREFAAGAGISTPAQMECSVCGYTSENRKHFKREGDSHVCATGHYTDDEGELKRSRNPYARR